MDEELDLTLDNENINKTEERIKNLSSKVKEKAQETENERALRAEAETRATTAEKERDFFQSFSSHSAKYPQASEHIDAIKEKVMAGYAPEDAILSVLNTEGKLMGNSEPVSYGPIAGGSAQTQLVGGSKSTSEMTRQEMRAKLLEADGRGELAEAIRNIR